MTNKTYEDLMIEYWGRVVLMVNEYNTKHDSDIKPWDCVKILGNTAINGHPLFNGRVVSYEFALAILEGKPVLV